MSNEGNVVKTFPSAHKGKRYLVTGASSGMGAAVCQHLAAGGAEITAVGRDEERLERTIDQCAGSGHRWLRADLMDADMQGLVEGVTSNGRLLDGIVHAAGLFRPALIADQSAEDLEQLWRTNVRAPYLLTQALLPSLSAPAAVVFVSSVSGHTGIAGQSAYAATKGAVEAVMRSLAIELAPRGIRVNSVAPGFIATEMNARLRDDGARVDKLSGATLAGRLGTTDDISRAVDFLLDARNSFVVGHCLRVDGGYPVSEVAKGVLLPRA